MRFAGNTKKFNNIFMKLNQNRGTSSGGSKDTTLLHCAQSLHSPSMPFYEPCIRSINHENHYKNTAISSYKTAAGHPYNHQISLSNSKVGISFQISGSPF